MSARRRRRAAKESEQRNRACVERLVCALNEGDVQAFADCYSDDVVIRWMRTGRTATGREAAAEWIAESFQAFDGLSNETVGVYSSGATVVLEVVARGTQIRELRGVPAGRILNNPEAYVYHFKDGKICEARCY